LNIRANEGRLVSNARVSTMKIRGLIIPSMKGGEDL
jgi:hypothetical protein